MPKIAETEDFASYLDQMVTLDPRLSGTARVLRAIEAAAIEMSALIGLGRLYGQLGASRGSTNTDGDVQKELDVLANDLFIDAFKGSPVAAVVSEELSEPLVLDPAGHLVVAMDPLDGSSNIDANISIGTIFSILPMIRGCECTRGPFPANWANATRRRLCCVWAADLTCVRLRERACSDLHP